MSAPAHEVPVWPSGVMSFDGRILEVTTGDGLRIAAGDLKEIEVGKVKRGNLNVKISYQAGLNKAKAGAWVPEENEAALRELVAAATGA